MGFNLRNLPSIYFELLSYYWVPLGGCPNQEIDGAWGITWFGPDKLAYYWHTLKPDQKAALVTACLRLKRKHLLNCSREIEEVVNKIGIG